MRPLTRRMPVSYSFMNSTKKRIIIYRVGAIGDVVHTLPFVKLLRKNNPEAQIEYIVGSRQLFDLLEQCTSYIDKVWLVSKKSLARDLSQIAKVDEFVFLHSGWLKAWWLNLRFIKASKLCIYKRDDSLSAVANYVTSYYPNQKSQLLVDAFKLLEWQTLTPISKGNIPAHLAPNTHHLNPYICIVPGVGNLRPHRAYPLNKWAELITKQLNNTDNNIILLGGPDEQELSLALDNILSAELTPELKLRVENLIGKTSLVDLVTILRQAQHLYSADTGILHIGAAVGVPITSVFSITSPKRFGPFSPNAKVTRSAQCLCEASSTNRPKHCKYSEDNIAKCMNAILARELVENDS